MSIRKVQKLDKRHNGRQLFKYYVEPDGAYIERYNILQAWREWCWDNYGPGTELKTALHMTDRRWRWAWDTEHGNARIYFKNDEELTWFTLKWQ